MKKSIANKKSAIRKYFCRECAAHIGTFNEIPDDKYKGFLTKLPQHVAIYIEGQVAVFTCPWCHAELMFSIDPEYWQSQDCTREMNT
jgi:hypothetical protein